MTEEPAKDVPAREIKHPRKCKACNSWLKNQLDGPPMCVNCYYRNKAKEEAERATQNVDAPIKPKIKIGKL